jgi:cyclopropane-fatty-acyl-phospholipid synthase
MASVAEAIRPLTARLFGGDPPVRIECWDGSSLGPLGGAAIILRSAAALRRLVWSPNEVGLGRAYVAGDVDIEGDVFALLSVRDALAAHGRETPLRTSDLTTLFRAARAAGALGLPPAPPPEEARLRGRLHSKARDAAAIAHHYDVGNDFYRLVLGETMTYSCAYFERESMSLDDAQRAKYDLVCRKLGLRPGMRLLDVGCGWGGMVMHAASRYGVRAVGVTLSRNQADLAAKRVADAGLSASVEIRYGDYRDLSSERFEAVSSIGMFEHVGFAQLGEYFSRVRALLAPRGRMLNHGISRPPGKPAIHRNTFIGRYVFPDGELNEVGSVVSAMQQAGFEVRDVESLREHYARTLRAWVANLEASWDEARSLAGDGRARVWRLYMAGSALGFEAGRTNIHQVLGVAASDDGDSGMPPTREEWLSAR